MTTLIHIKSNDRLNSGGAIWQEVVSNFAQTTFGSDNITVHKFSFGTLWAIRQNKVDGIIYEHPYNLLYALIWASILRLLGHKPYIVYSMHNDEPALFRSGVRKKSIYNLCKFLIADFLATGLSSKVIAPASLKNREVSGVDFHYITLTEKRPTKQLENFKTGSIRLSFIGSSFWQPNLNGLLKFVGQFEAYSKYIQQVTVVGDGWASVIPQNDKIYCAGYVEDLSEIIADTDIFIAPIEDNYGINVKLYEYLKYDKPILSTYEASRGIDSPLITNLDLEHWYHFFNLISHE